MRWPGFSVLCFVSAAFMSGSLIASQAARPKVVQPLAESPAALQHVDPRVVGAVVSCFAGGGYCLDNMETVALLTEAGKTGMWGSRILLRAHVQREKGGDPEINYRLQQLLELTAKTEEVFEQINNRAQKLLHQKQPR